MSVLHTFIFSHLIHHRGQPAVFLRQLEVPLPPVYGPTADKPMFPVAQVCAGPATEAGPSPHPAPPGEGETCGCPLRMSAVTLLRMHVSA
ncbi:MAG: hypothetical protein JXQ27_14330 [Acidobacteria bacterium]|nr:hypothetical protein [Acidobacteriota bacterium]